ncbi:MAG: 50S ribosomal protein L15 [Thermoanaerobaculia bacterium]|nr:50S ribosomal protein L15 [Thermoanaerobaculia bacterium]MBP7812333.1 50S ribosomal protein L15 [Thermoanaerobaculia bacterium]OQC41948.1 MAG: 50S ribosomal protein L15 [Acidobacteria bacterium ADurb.Bin051]
MKLHELSPAPGSRKNRKRVGRGIGSGNPKTSGRGHKGGKSRSGASTRPGFEGGQMPLVRRVPKRGFKNIFRIEYAVVNLAQFDRFEGEVDPAMLAARGLVPAGKRVKVLGQGELGRALRVRAHAFSASARAKIEAAGGVCEELSA